MDGVSGSAARERNGKWPGWRRVASEDAGIILVSFIIVKKDILQNITTTSATIIINRNIAVGGVNGVDFVYKLDCSFVRYFFDNLRS